MDVNDTWQALVRSALPRIDYYALYRGAVVAWHPRGRSVDPKTGEIKTIWESVDVEIDDPRLPHMGGIPFRHGLPGLEVDNIDGIKNKGVGTTVLVGWEGGDPSRPYAVGWAPADLRGLSLTLTADQIILGGADGAEPAAKGKTLQDYLESLASALTKHTHVSAAPGSPTTPAATPGTDLLETTIKPPTITATNVQVK